MRILPTPETTVFTWKQGTGLTNSSFVEDFLFQSQLRLVITPIVCIFLKNDLRFHSPIRLIGLFVI